MVPMDGTTVGRAAELVGVTVRTLHHYDAVGLVRPGGRSPAGYRLYTEDDLRRLRAAVAHRRLGLPVKDVASMLDDPSGAVEHLRRRRDELRRHLAETTDVLHAVERALQEEDDMDVPPVDHAGPGTAGFDDPYHDEAQARWGGTTAWAQSQARTAAYTAQDWQAVHAGAAEVEAAFVAALDAGEPADGPVAAAAVRAQRDYMNRWFFDLEPALHACIAESYVQDPRFMAHYEALREGLARYVRDAVHAEVARA